MLGFYAFNDSHRIWKTLKFFWIITGISAIYGITQLLRGYTPVELSWIQQLPATMKIAGTSSYRLMSSFGSAVDFSAVLVLAMTSLGGVLLVRRERSIWRLCLYGLMAIALLFTYVRAAWIALLFGGIFLLLAYFWHIRLVRLLFFPSITIIVLSIGLLLWGTTLIASDLPNAALQERIGSLSNPLQDKSMLDRFDNWSEAWKVVEEHPLGIGIGMTGAASIKYSDNSGLSLITLDNSYLEILVTTGWPGLFLFIILVFSMVTKLVLLPGHLHEDSRLLAICLGSSVISYLVIMFFGEYIELNPARTIVWILAGMAFSLPRILKALLHMKKTMKTLLISHTSDMNGAELSLLDLALGLVQRNIEVCVLCPDEGPLCKQLRENDVPVTVFWLLRPQRNLLRLLGFILLWFPLVLNLTLYIKRGGFEIIYNNTIDGLYGPFAARLAGVPCVWHVRALNRAAMWEGNSLAGFLTGCPRAACSILRRHRGPIRQTLLRTGR